MSLKRKYDIGGNTIIEDDGHYLSANHRKDDKSSCSIGCKRSSMLPMPEELKVIFSQSGKEFYLLDYTHSHGFWLGIKKFDTQEQCQDKMPSGMVGKPCASFTVEGKTHFRALYHFAYWKISHEQKERLVKRTEDYVQDYLALAQNDVRDQEKRFNEVIAHTGWTLKKIMEKIGPWVPVEEIPIIKLEQ